MTGQTVPSPDHVDSVLGEGWDNAWPTGMDLVTTWEAEPRPHPRMRTCEGCDESVMTTGITELGYYFQTCECAATPYPHIVQRICHLRCMARRSPDLAADAMLQNAAHILDRYKLGQDMARQIRDFCEKLG